MQTSDIYVKNLEYIDSKPYFASWEIDIFLVFSTFFGLGLMLANSFFTLDFFIGTGMLSAYFYNKIKNSRVKGFFWHLLYTIGLKKTKTLPPSYMRFFLGA